MKSINVIIKKELKRVFGDKKLVFSLFILPAILVIGIYSLMGVVSDAMNSDIEKHISNVYMVNVPDSMKSVIETTGFKEDTNIVYLDEAEYSSQKDEIYNEILEARVDLLVYVDEKLETKVAEYKNAGDSIPVIKLGYNQTSNYSGAAYNKYINMVENPFRDSLLANRFGNLDLLKVFDTEEENIVKEEKANSQFLSMMLPYLIVMLLFAGAMSIGIDAIAGEKERGTLASMLLSPAKRSEIVWGKLISLMILSGLSSVIYAGSMIIASPIMSTMMGGGDENILSGVSFGPLQIAELVVTMLALVFLFVAVIGMLATYAKDTKTASSLTAPAYIVVIIAGMLTMFATGAEIPVSRYAIPIYGNALVIRDICSNEVVFEKFGASLIGTIVIGIICVVAMTKAFNSEKIMFDA